MTLIEALILLGAVHIIIGLFVLLIVICRDGKHFFRQAKEEGEPFIITLFVFIKSCFKVVFLWLPLLIIEVFN